MPLVQWESRFLTGDPRVDSQHQSLFQMLNDLHDSISTGESRETQRRVLVRLARYTIDHFAAEERLMIASQYPRLVAHKNKHNELRRKTRDILTQHAPGDANLSITLVKFLSEWLCNHINQEDMKMTAWLREKRGQSKAA